VTNVTVELILRRHCRSTSTRPTCAYCERLDVIAEALDVSVTRT
jgi:hypothetical protein